MPPTGEDGWEADTDPIMLSVGAKLPPMLALLLLLAAALLLPMPTTPRRVMPGVMAAEMGDGDAPTPPPPPPPESTPEAEIEASPPLPTPLWLPLFVPDVEALLVLLLWSSAAPLLR